MKHKAFIALVFLSLLIAAGLCGGYLARVGPMIAYVPSTPGVVSLREFDLITDKGRFEIFWGTAQTKPPPNLEAGINVRWSMKFPRTPDLRRSVWEFDAHPLSLPSGTAFIIAFPLWCLILPSLVTPAIWLRKRLRDRRQTRGFEVQEIPVPAAG